MNKELQTVADRLQKNIDEVPVKFLRFPEGELNRKPAPNKWSKKEILGHLIDSAANNHHRFIKAQFEKEPFIIVAYEQDYWVNIQKYNEVDSKYLVELWRLYNQHIHWIISNFPNEKLSVKCRSIDDREPAENVFLLIKDYVDHMDHHLEQIFNN
jgi:DinB superfamily